MTASQAFAYIGIPLILFVLGGIGTGIVLLVKGSAYMATSAAAQKSIAASSAEINTTLKAYIASNDLKVNDLDRRVYAMERGEKDARDRG